jgi:signal transduction histidine kinase
LSRELHDDVGQALALIAVLARTLQVQVAPGLAPRVGDLQTLAQDAADATRQLVGKLRTEPQEDLTLRTSLERLAREVVERDGVGGPW